MSAHAAKPGHRRLHCRCCGCRQARKAWEAALPRVGHGGGGGLHAHDGCERHPPHVAESQSRRRRGRHARRCRSANPQKEKRVREVPHSHTKESTRALRGGRRWQSCRRVWAVAAAAATRARPEACADVRVDPSRAAGRARLILDVLHGACLPSEVANVFIRGRLRAATYALCSARSSPLRVRGSDGALHVQRVGCAGGACIRSGNTRGVVRGGKAEAPRTGGLHARARRPPPRRARAVGGRNHARAFVFFAGGCGSVAAAVAG